MKSLRYLFIVLGILLVILIIIFISISRNKGELGMNEDEFEAIVSEEVTKMEIQVEENYYKYSYTSEIITKLFDYISEKENNINNSEAVLSVLDNEYIEENNLSETNVLDFFAEYKNINSYATKKIYTQDLAQLQNRNGQFIYIDGVIRKGGNTKHVYIIINEDFLNSTYNISFVEETTFDNLINGSLLSDKMEINVEENEYNKIYSKEITEYQMCLDHLNDYINILNNNVSDAYDVLDQEYRNKRFGSLESYKFYIEQKKQELQNIRLKEYAIERKDEYTQYICQDQYDNYYIFRDTSIMNYSLILDIGM